MKKCRMCNKNRDISNYQIKINSKDGFDNFCKDCNKIKRKKRNDSLKKYSIEYNYISPTKICRICNQTKNKSKFSTQNYGDGYVKKCKSCYRNCKKIWIKNNPKKKKEYENNYSQNHWQHYIIHTCDNKLRKLKITDKKNYKNLKKEISVTFLNKLKQKQNEKCHWFGIDIDFSRNDWLRSPSLDRLDNNKGYTRDNVVLTCRFANLARNRVTKKVMQNFVSENFQIA